MAYCYIFNPATSVLPVTLNGSRVGMIFPAKASESYQPRSIAVPVARYNDPGSLAIGDQNTITVYPDDPQQYTVSLCLPGRLSVDNDDIIIYVGRPPSVSAASVVTMTSQGLVLDTRCPAAAPRHSRRARSIDRSAEADHQLGERVMPGNVYCFNAYSEPMSQLSVNEASVSKPPGGWAKEGSTIYTPFAVSVPRARTRDTVGPVFPNDCDTPMRIDWSSYTIRPNISKEILRKVPLDRDVILYIAVNQVTLMDTSGTVWGSWQDYEKVGKTSAANAVLQSFAQPKFHAQ